MKNIGKLKVAEKQSWRAFATRAIMPNSLSLSWCKGLVCTFQAPSSCFWLLASGFLLISSCTPPTHLPEKALSAYVMDESKGLYQKKEVNGLDLSLYYKPTGLLVAQEADKNTNVTELEALNKKYESYAYFILDIAAGEKNALYSSGSFDAFSENLQTLAFRMDQYANLTTSANDTIPVGDFIYPRMYGMSKSATVMFAFNKEKFKEAKWVSFNLNEFGMRTGDQQFRFDIDDINKVPKLKIERLN